MENVGPRTKASLKRCSVVNMEPAVNISLHKKKKSPEVIEAVDAAR